MCTCVCVGDDGTVYDSTDVVHSLHDNGKSNIPTTSCYWWSLFGLKFIFWCILQVLFVELEFGVVFFVGSCIFFIVYSLKGSRRDPSRLSAYSIFNSNFERIEGTLTAEQFEKEIRHGPASVH